VAHPRRIITSEERRKVLRLVAQGASWSQILREVADSSRMVHTVLREAGGKIWVSELRDTASHTGHFLRLEERQEIWIGLKSNESFRSIARRLCRAPTTISREVERNGGREGYQPFTAERRAVAKARRPRQRKLVEGGALFERVRADLERLWSPEEISARLRREFGDDRS
jgi:transposase, IS30 family